MIKLTNLIKEYNKTKLDPSIKASILQKTIGKKKNSLINRYRVILTTVSSFLIIFIFWYIYLNNYNLKENKINKSLVQTNYTDQIKQENKLDEWVKDIDNESEFKKDLSKFDNPHLSSYDKNISSSNFQDVRWVNVNQWWFWSAAKTSAVSVMWTWATKWESTKDIILSILTDLWLVVIFMIAFIYIARKHLKK